MDITPPGLLDMTLRLFVAGFIGGLVGFERETHGQAAGLRTHTLVAIGACTAMIVSMYIPVLFPRFADGGRIAAQVISGIGFLGAGAIIRYGASVRGLTTAAGLWAVSGTGLAAGAGMYFLAATSAVMVLIVIHVLDVVKKKFIKEIFITKITVTMADEEGIIGDLEELLEEHQVDIKHIGIRRLLKEDLVEVEIRGNVTDDMSPPIVSQRISEMDPVIEVEISNS